MINEIEILYEDEYLVAVNKPNGLLVHRTSIAEETEEFLLQKVRDQLGGDYLFPIHRLDRPTSGVVLLARTSEVASLMQPLFQQSADEKRIRKEYVALVRGWLAEEMILNFPVKTEKGKSVEAETHFVPLRRIELPFATDRYSTARFSIIQAFPHSGRWHQIRQHLAHLRHYIINDRVHGDGKQNRLMDEQLGIRDFFLHARSLSFIHPFSQKQIDIQAPFPSHWKSFAVKE